MQTDFTPVTALLGGALIGVAAVVLYAGIGRIAGISGILNAAIERSNERTWRIAFLIGLMLGAGAWFAFAPDVAAPRTGFRPAMLVAAGLLVGIGTRLGNGCTSGHGICGLARLSKRSLVAVIVFMACGMVTVWLVHHAAWLSA